MIYLPAAAGRTTRRMSQAGSVAAIIGGGLTLAVIAADIFGGDDALSHPALYQVTIGCAAVAATLLGVAHMRTLIMQSAMGTMAELARMSESQRRMADEMGALAAEYADLADTNRQMVAEVARMRTALREAEADRKADAEKWLAEIGHLGDQLAERTAETVRLRAAVERAEAERKTRFRDQIAAMASLRSQVWRLAAALERRAKEAGDRAEYWRVYGDVMKDLGGLGDEGGGVDPE